jgi:3-oxoisoapionate decarboxylase
MKRRQFLEQTSRAAMTLPFLRMPALADGMRMGIIVHSYAHRWNSKVKSEKYPAFLDAIDLMEHCHNIGAGGIQVIVRDWTQDFASKVRDRREKLGLYIEGSIGLPKTESDIPAFEREIVAAKEAGAEITRTVCLSGRRYETFQSLGAFQEFKRNSIASLKWAEPVVRKHKMKLAVENHKDWRAAEMLTILRDLDSEWVGVNLDFGNNIALMEDPVDVVNALAPYLFTTHVKDMGVQEYADGFLLSEVPLGQGFLDLKKIFEVCKAHKRDVKFNLEMITRDPLKIPCLTDAYWSTFTDVRPQDMARALHLVRQNIHGASLPQVSGLRDELKLAVEEQNILTSLQYSKSQLGH